jgi:hypothetical protein
MKSFGSLSASSQRVALVVGLAAFAVLCAASGLTAEQAQSQAQTPPPQQTPAPAAQPAESGLTAKSSPAVFLNVVKPDKTADFEAAMAKIKEALSKTDKPELKKLADGWSVYKVAETTQAGSTGVIYIWLINPAEVGSAYDPGKIIYDVFPRAEADEIFNKLKDSYVNLQRWTLDKLADMKAGG